MSWSDLWSYFNRQGKEVQKDILKQLDLGNWIDSVSTTVRIEILKFAPASIKQKYNYRQGQPQSQKTPEQLRRELNRMFK